MNSNLGLILHAAFGAAVIGAVAALAAVGTLSADQAVTFITGVTTFVLGVGATAVGASSSTVPPTSTTALPK